MKERKICPFAIGDEKKICRVKVNSVYVPVTYITCPFNGNLPEWGCSVYDANELQNNSSNSEVIKE